MDPLSPAHRSHIMSRIRSKDTGPEMLVRRFLWKAGVRYRLHPKDIPGTPDLWFPKKQIAVFVHGCFWHGHEACALYRLPKTDTSKWLAKVERNQTRDQRDLLRLLASGVQVVTLWECALRLDSDLTIGFLYEFLHSEHPPATVLEVRAQSGVVHSTVQQGRWD